MSRKLLGESFDIHGGGLDLMFPHHENEIAQSESCHGQPMAKYWMHNGLMQASSEVGKLGGRNTRPAEGDLAAQEVGKISKSKGSAPFRDMLKQFSGETIRFFVLSTQYRRPIDYSEERLREVETGMDTFPGSSSAMNVSPAKATTLATPATRTEGDARFAPPTAARRGAGADGQSAAERGLTRQLPTRCYRPSPTFAIVSWKRSTTISTPAAASARCSTWSGRSTSTPTTRSWKGRRPHAGGLSRFSCQRKWDCPLCPHAGQARRIPSHRHRARELTGTLGLFRKPQEQKAPGGDDLTGKLMALLIDLGRSPKRKDFATADRIRNTLGQIGVALEDRPGGTESSASRSTCRAGSVGSTCRVGSGRAGSECRGDQYVEWIGTPKSGSASRTYYWLTAFSACATYGKQGRAGPRPAASTSPAPARPPSRSR